MITSVNVENFRCIESLSLRMSPLTVLVGPNASGKSTLLDVFRPGTAFVASDFRFKNPKNACTLIVSFAGGAVREGRPSAGHLGIPTNLFGGRVQRLMLELRRMREANLVASAPSLSTTGDNLTNLFATLTRKQQQAVAMELTRLVPMFSDVDAVPTESGRHELRFQDRWNEKVWYRPEEVSDGTMLLLAFLLLQHQPQVPALITIEEPERGFHPYLLGQFVDYLRKLTRGELGAQPIQVLMATHSADLLDHLDPDEVRFLRRRSSDGAVEISEIPTGTDEWQEARREYRESLGDIWLSGGLGGVPG